MSLINWHQIKVQTWPVCNRLKRICDSIRRYSNPAKCYDGHVWQYIAGIFYSEMLVAECNDDILDTRYFFLTSQNHMDRTRNFPLIHSRPPLQRPLANEFDPNHVYYQHRLCLEPRNYPELFAVSIEMTTMRLIKKQSFD